MGKYRYFTKNGQRKMSVMGIPGRPFPGLAWTFTLGGVIEFAAWVLSGDRSNEILKQVNTIGVIRPKLKHNGANLWSVTGW